MEKLTFNPIEGTFDVIDVSVEHFDNLPSFPVPGQVNLLYVAKDTGTIYYWNNVLMQYSTTTGAVPNLQQVTTQGNGTNTTIFITDGTIRTTYKKDGIESFQQGNVVNSRLNINFPIVPANTTRNQIFQDADGTIALLSDIANASVGNILQNGNSFAQDVRIGSNDLQSFIFETNNTEAMRLDTSQRLLINTTATLGTYQKLQVKGATVFDNLNTIDARVNSGAFNHLSDGKFNISGLNTGYRFGQVNSHTITLENGGNFLVRDSTQVNTVIVNTNIAGGSATLSGRAMGTWNNLVLNNSGTMTQDASIQGGSTAIFNELLIDSTNGIVADDLNVNVGQLQISGLVSSTIDSISIYKAQTRPNAPNPSIIQQLNYYRASHTIGSLPGVQNTVGYFVSSTIDNIGIKRTPFLSESTGTSFHQGDFEFAGAVKLRGLTNYISLQAPTSTSAYTLRLPTTIGLPGQILQTDGINQTIWVDPNINDIPEWIAPPLNSTSPGLQGQKAYDNLYIYFCVQDNLWERTAKDLTVW